MRVVVTRAAHQAEQLAAPLRDLGAEVILLPVIGIAPPRDPEPLERAVRACDSYDWILFASVNAVTAFTSHLVDIPKAFIATVGQATREAAEKIGFEIHVTPEKYVAEALIEALGNEDFFGKRVLIPSASHTRDVIAPALRARGALVDVVEAYRNVIPPDALERATNVFRKPLPDWIAFASSSAVTNTLTLVDRETIKQMKTASIGPVTSATIREYGIEPSIEAREHTIGGLVRAVFSC